MPKKVNWKLVVFCLLVCIASGFVGLVFGLLAEIPYNQPMAMRHRAASTQAARPATVDLALAGLAFGGASGVLAGLLWCGVMVFRVLPRPAPRRIVSPGMFWGLVVGVLSTCILHLGLKMMVPPDIPSELPVGLMFGIPAGTVMGMICGAVLELLAPPPQEQAPT